MLNSQELEQYKRQMMIENWGTSTQEDLKESAVFIAGAGGLGSPVSFYLAAAGVGRLKICDFDSPDWSNLNRQILHDPTRIGVNKAVSAKMTIERLNPHVRVTALTDRIVADNVDELVGDSRLIVDCMDNFATRYLLNEAAIRKSIPLVYGSMYDLEGRLSFIQVPETPCLRCVIAEAPPKEVFPVLGATPGVIGTLQAMEALKFLTGTGSNLKGRLLVWDGLTMDFRTYAVRKDPECPACSGTLAAGGSRGRS